MICIVADPTRVTRGGGGGGGGESMVGGEGKDTACKDYRRPAFSLQHLGTSAKSLNCRGLTFWDLVHVPGVRASSFLLSAGGSAPL